MQAACPAPLFAGSNQPARRGLDIHSVAVAGEDRAVTTRAIHVDPFCVLTECAVSGDGIRRNALLVAPLSGHFPVLLRDVVVGLLPWFRVHITDWVNVRHVPAAHGSFDLGSNIAAALDAMRRLAPDLTVIAVCQAGVPALAAAAILAAGAGADADALAPARLVLIGAPIDPLANPTRLVRLLRAQTLDDMERTLTDVVSHPYAGFGRRVYPAWLQLSALESYLTRNVCEGGELCGKLFADDGSDPVRFPFLDAFTSIMDLDASYFLENTRSLYHDRDICEGRLRFAGSLVDPGAIRRARLMTIEGEWDDIAAPGQTRAAHQLCTSVANASRHHLVVPRCGHLSLIHGQRWRRDVLPEVLRFAGINGQPATAPCNGCG